MLLSLEHEVFMEHESPKETATNLSTHDYLLCLFFKNIAHLYSVTLCWLTLILFDSFFGCFLKSRGYYALERRLYTRNRATCSTLSPLIDLKMTSCV